MPKRDVVTVNSILKIWDFSFLSWWSLQVKLGLQTDCEH